MSGRDRDVPAQPSALCAVLIVLSLVVPATAAAQPVGSGPWAMPSLHRVLVATETEPGVDVAALAGYGYTEDVLGASDSHHRVGGSVALAGRPLSWLTIAGRVDGRWDHHLLGGNDDQSAVGEARLALRGDWGVAPGFALGLATLVLVPGSDAPSLVFDATTVDLRALASWTPDGLPLTFALDLGYRFDRTARAVQRPVPFGRADLVTLGASDSDAALLGFGVVGRVDETEIFGEVTADVFVEHGLAASPVRLAAGARIPLVPRLLSLHAALEAGLGGRIAVDPAGTLVPIEPRVALLVGLVLAPRSTAAPPIEEPVDAPRDDVARGRVLDENGAPIAGARVHVAADGASTITDDDGAFELEGVPPGTALEVEADGYVSAPLTGDSVVLTRVVGEAALRGLVRSLSGRRVTATITVAPGGATASTDADGVFELALAPGHYEVTISARGHVTQHREVDVEVGGVTVLNIDLRGARQ